MPLVAARREIAMLYLSRKLGEAVIINHDVEVRVAAISGKAVSSGSLSRPRRACYANGWWKRSSRRTGLPPGPLARCPRSSAWRTAW
jgi:hypothetical protein